MPLFKFVPRRLAGAAAIAILMLLGPAEAQTLVREFDSDQAGKNVVMNADTLTYDEAQGLVTAAGNVEIAQGELESGVLVQLS